MEAIIFCGIQATGKTTFYAQRFLQTHVRISMDLLRTRHREGVFLRACFDTQARFVVDNTNPSRAERAVYIEPAKARKYRVVGYFFESSLHEAIQRNAQRTGREKIPEVGLRAAAKRLEVPAWDEGFDELYRVRMDGTGSFAVEPVLPEVLP